MSNCIQFFKSWLAIFKVEKPFVKPLAIYVCMYIACRNLLLGSKLNIYAYDVILRVVGFYHIS